MKYDSIRKLNDIHNYIMQMRPILDRSALFSDGTKDYRIPQEPDSNERVTLRFRTAANNVDQVFLCYEDQKMEMRLAEQEGKFDYYEASVQLSDQPFFYWFEVVSGALRCFYDRIGAARELRTQYKFEIVPGFRVPQWARGAVMYQIFTDRFCNGDPSNDVENGEYYYIDRLTKKVDNWEKNPADFDVADFYGGDLAGVLSKMDYLQGLGVEVLYFNPLFVSASSHKYDIQDYDYVDPHFGVILEDSGEVLKEGETDNRKAGKFRTRVTSRKNLEASNKLFIRLVEEAHKRGMRVILDGVFNHCGSFNKWLDREKIYEGKESFPAGAFLKKDSVYHDYFRFQSDEDFPDNRSYEGWWGHETLPKLNYEGSKELEEYILSIAAKWVSPPYCADGWRLDVAADLGHTPEYNHVFWRKFRSVVKEANPQALILAEHYGDPKPWLGGDQWDTVMNYDAFMEPVSWFLTGMEKHSEEYKDYMLGNLQSFQDTMKHYMANFMTSSLQCSMNQLSNHDHSRFLTRTNHRVGRACQLGAAAASEGINKGILKEAVVIQMTWPGAPTLYYGDEAGVCGFTDPDNRRTYPWGNEDRELLEFHRNMIAIHRSSDALRCGSVKFLEGSCNVLCYGRFTRTQQFVVIVNNNEQARAVEISVTAVGIEDETVLVQRMYTTRESYSTAPVEYQVHEGRLKITLPKWSGLILENKRKNQLLESCGAEDK